MSFTVDIVASDIPRKFIAHENKFLIGLLDNGAFCVYRPGLKTKSYTLPRLEAESEQPTILAAAWHSDLLHLLDNYGTISCFRTVNDGSFNFVKRHTAHSISASTFTHGCMAAGDNGSKYIATTVSDGTTGGQIKVWIRVSDVALRLSFTVEPAKSFPWVSGLAWSSGQEAFLAAYAYYQRIVTIQPRGLSGTKVKEIKTDGWIFSWSISTDTTLALIYDGAQTVRLIDLADGATRAVIPMEFVDVEQPQPALYFSKDIKIATVLDEVKATQLNCSNGDIVSQSDLHNVHGIHGETSQGAVLAMPADDVAMLRLYMTLQMDWDLGDDPITQQLAGTSQKRPSAETSIKLNKRQRTT